VLLLLCAVPDKPIISDVISGDSYVLVAWQITSADDANPGHTFYIRYRLTGDHIMSQVIVSSALREEDALLRYALLYSACYDSCNVGVFLNKQRFANKRKYR